ncbi:MAG: 3-oxoacyl-ACP synthase III family protein [Chitinophagales bacterium]
MFRTVIAGTGSYIPSVVKTNQDFAKQSFYSKGSVLSLPTGQIIEKFRQITSIEERRYVTDNLTASAIGSIAAKNAIEDSGVDPEEIDQLIVAHNFGEVNANSVQSLTVPSVASSIKHSLLIKNPNCIAYDILFGCPGWIQAMIQADAFFKAGLAKKALIVGTETLSRVIDNYDRDSMIFSDGAGAAVLEYKDVTHCNSGFLASGMQTYTTGEVNYIYMGASCFPGREPETKYMKMNGRKVYEFAVLHVPAAMKSCLDKAGIHISEVKKIFIHQANAKMDEGIIDRLYHLYDIEKPPEKIIPMSIHWLGNSSVATVPTLLDLVRKNLLEDHHLSQGDIILLASVGAGMNVNAICYRY